MWFLKSGARAADTALAGTNQGGWSVVQHTTKLLVESRQTWAYSGPHGFEMLGVAGVSG